MKSLRTLTITDASRALQAREFSVRELVHDCLTAIHKEQPRINAFIEVLERAERDADDADRVLRQKQSNGEKLPPLFGIPIAIKDNILIQDVRATAGSKMLEHYVASYDATVIEKLKSAGAIFIGKTNMDEFAMGSSTEYSAYGPTKNPHDVTRVPGGSSGGSAAAVAADLALASLGSDTGGSIRQPAAFCGIVGFKPTYGAVSRHGLIAMASSLDQIGPMTKTVADARIVFDAIRGRDPFDATSDPQESAQTDAHHTKIRGLKIGIPKEYFMEGLDPDIERTIRSTIDILATHGAEIVDITLPHTTYALPVYYIIVPSEVSSNLARFDGVRYGHRTDTANSLLEVYEHTRKEGFGVEVKRRIMLGTYTLSAGYYDAYYGKAQRVRRLISEDFERAFRRVDVILGPTTPSAAFKFGDRSDPVGMYLADIYTVAANLAGVPAISIPAGFIKKDLARLPVGLQLIASRRQDDALLTIASEIESLIKR